MLPDDPRHGARSGYQQHVADREDPCDACKRANTDYHQAYRNKNAEYVQRERDRSAAYSRARTRLTELHAAEFEILYREELLR